MNEDILCEAPGPGGTTCTMPYGHDGNVHSFEVQLPPHIARLIDNYISELEKQARSAKRWKYTWCALAAVYLVLIVAQLLGF